MSRNRMSITLWLFLSSLFLTALSAYPTVLIHGILSNKGEMAELQTYLQEDGGLVYNIEIGDGEMTSIFDSMNKQCELVAEAIQKLDLSENKTNLIGISQGGLLARCYVERYSTTIIPVNSLITIATPHMGIYYQMDGILGLAGFAIPDYWKDPYNYWLYYTTNTFLSYLNNEKIHVNWARYKASLLSISHFVMVWSSIDNVIVPLESAKFQFYDILTAERERKLVVVPLGESFTYKYDAIGLKTLNESNRLHMYQFDCQHDRFKLPSCFAQLKNKNNRTLIDVIKEYL
jgi:pimeloyl-ACP methyl ester carboxylesterase